MSTDYGHTRAVDVMIRIDLDSAARTSEKHHPAKSRRQFERLGDDRSGPGGFDDDVKAAPVANLSSGGHGVPVGHVDSHRDSTHASGLQSAGDAIHDHDRASSRELGELRGELTDEPGPKHGDAVAKGDPREPNAVETDRPKSGQGGNVRSYAL